MSEIPNSKYVGSRMFYVNKYTPMFVSSTDFACFNSLCSCTATALTSSPFSRHRFSGHTKSPGEITEYTPRGNHVCARSPRHLPGVLRG